MSKSKLRTPRSSPRPEEEAGSRVRVLVGGLFVAGGLFVLISCGGQVTGGVIDGGTRREGGHDGRAEAAVVDSGSSPDAGASDVHEAGVVCARVSDAAWLCGDATVQRCMEGIEVGVSCESPPAQGCFAYCGANGRGQEYVCDSGAGWHELPTLIPCSE
jgi:hypothetical protein